MRKPGFKHTLATKLKIGEANSRRIYKVCKLCKSDYFVPPARENKTSFCSNKCRLSVPIRPKDYRHSLETKKKISEAHIGVRMPCNSGDKNYLWKGNDVTYSGLHHWIASRLGKPDKCETCLSSGLRGHKIHWANKSQRYKRNVDDWIRLCAKCHNSYDKGKIKQKPKL